MFARKKWPGHVTGLWRHKRNNLRPIFVTEIEFSSPKSYFHQLDVLLGGMEKLCVNCLGQEITTSQLLAFPMSSEVTDLHCPLRYWPVVNKFTFYGFLEVLRPNTGFFTCHSMSLSSPSGNFPATWRSPFQECSTSQLFDQSAIIAHCSVQNWVGNTLAKIKFSTVDSW